MKKITKIVKSPEGEQWYEALVEECRAIIVEAEFASRWNLIEGYHLLGKRILEENKNFERAKIYGQGIVPRLAESLGKSERVVWRAVQFARKYPILDDLPGGKNLSWHEVIVKYLPEMPENKVEIPLPVICKKCPKHCP